MLYVFICHSFELLITFLRLIHYYSDFSAGVFHAFGLDFFPFYSQDAILTRSRLNAAINFSI